MTGTARTIAEELEANRARLFVGRAAEVEAFTRVLSADQPGTVFFLHGAGGIGKTTLLHALEVEAVRAGYEVVRFDAREVPADPALVGSMLDGLLDGVADATVPTLLAIDTFEEWAAIESWFRDTFLASLPSGMRVALAGRQPPGLRWRSDAGWHDVLIHRELGPLSPVECIDYLTRRVVSEGIAERAAAASRGQPLLLALIADAGGCPRGC